MADLLTVEVVTPQHIILEAQAEWVTIPGSEGEMGILEDHAPLLTNIISGTLTYLDKKSGKEVTLAVHNGYAQVAGNRVTVLSQAAEYKEQIDVERAKQSEADGREAMNKLLADKEKSSDQEKLLQIEHAILRAQTRLALAGK